MTDDGRLSIVIADDHPIFREGLRHLVDAEPDMVVAGTAADGREALGLVRATDPDILLLDLAMPRYPWLDVLRELAMAESRTRVIVLTAAVDAAQSVELVRLGARGIVMKDTALDLLMKAIRLVMQGQYWVGREAVSSVVSALRRAPAGRLGAASPFGLTPRQIQIVKAVATGASNREIARQFAIAEDTVKQHITTAFDKCGVSSRVELAMFAVNHRIVDL